MVVYMHLIWTCGVQEKITDRSNVYILFVVGSRLFFFTFSFTFLVMVTGWVGWVAVALLPLWVIPTGNVDLVLPVALQIQVLLI